MGVSGCGKSTVGAALADSLGLVFTDGDRLHPEANIAKMSRGEALTDGDRWPWLTAVGETLAGPEGGVIACSALRRAYRDLIRRTAGGPVHFLLLDGTPEEMTRRLGNRPGHFMPASLVASQFATLERPTGDEPDVLAVDATRPIADLVATATAFVARS
ncbi:gluconokinase [Oryzibacter oryziterrae]|uniref:gluconokinase n=1 Tax=Oryzibacter oryziterrae TaxID=2766474 RepID=UPI001F1DAF22|nr:gluconokinase [Oryzibacter oryziterrae]